MAISAIDINLVVDSMLNHSKVAFLSSLEPLRFVHHLGNRLTAGWCLIWRWLLWWLFICVGDEHVFDYLVIGYVNGLLSVIIGLIDVCSIGQQYSNCGSKANASSVVEWGVAIVL